MIAKITRGADPGRIGAYLHGPGRAEEHVYEGRLGGAVIAGTVPVLEPRASQEWVAEMRAAIARRPDVTRPVCQASLRSAPGDRVMTDAEWADAAQGSPPGWGSTGTRGSRSGTVRITCMWWCPGSTTPVGCGTAGSTGAWPNRRAPSWKPTTTCSGRRGPEPSTSPSGSGG